MKIHGKDTLRATHGRPIPIIRVSCRSWKRTWWSVNAEGVQVLKEVRGTRMGWTRNKGRRRNKSRAATLHAFQRPHTVEQFGDGHRLNVVHATIALHPLVTRDTPHKSITCSSKVEVCLLTCCEPGVDQCVEKHPRHEMLQPRQHINVRMNTVP